jgi:hypothetical protein
VSRVANQESNFMRFLFELASDDVFISHFLDVAIKVFGMNAFILGY